MLKIAKTNNKYRITGPEVMLRVIKAVCQATYTKTHGIYTRKDNNTKFLEVYRGF